MPFDVEDKNKIIELGLGKRRPKNGLEKHFVGVCQGKGKAFTSIEKEWVRVWESYKQSKKEQEKEKEIEPEIRDDAISGETYHSEIVCGGLTGDLVKVQPNILKECSELYSNHYGSWSEKSSVSPGKRVRLSSEKIREWLDMPGSKLFYAYSNDKLVGYSIAVTEKIKRYGSVAWVTQLVVHKDYRNQGIGKELLFSIWTFSDFFAWGVLTSSPYAIRALEKATRRRCLPVMIDNYKSILLKFGHKHVSYVDESMELEVNKEVSRINTKFFADHSQLNKMVSDVSNADIPWILGNLFEGWEWFAFTFKKQDQLKLTPSELEDMLTTSDKVTRQAYSRMSLDGNHSWAKHTDYEVDFILDACQAADNASILDFGCGSGRHSVSLVKKGYNVTAVDYNQYISDDQLSSLKNLEFVKGDCRSINHDRLFQIAFCLYDVIGSYVSEEDNLRIINKLYSHLEKGGYAFISVMNYELTESLATNFFSLSKEFNRLLELPPSQTMETTGNIFDPDHFMIDTDSNIVYRKEQFAKGVQLQEELLVRDKRFTRSEINNLCQSVGFKVLWSRYVSIGKWNESLSPNDPRAKEILLFCKKN